MWYYYYMWQVMKNKEIEGGAAVILPYFSIKEFITITNTLVYVNRYDADK